MVSTDVYGMLDLGENMEAIELLNSGECTAMVCPSQYEYDVANYAEGDAAVPCDFEEVYNYDYASFDDDGYIDGFDDESY